MKGHKIIRREGFFPSDGRWLFYKCWHAYPQKGEVIFLHSLFDHGGRYFEIGEEFAKNGYSFYVFDFTGHGKSEGKRGFVYHYEEFIVDIANFYGFMSIYRKMKRPFLIGHGFGGVLATIFASWGKCPLRGVIPLSPTLDSGGLSFWQKTLWNFLSLTYPTFSIKNMQTPSILTHDKEVMKEYVTDPFIPESISCRCLSESLKASKYAFTTASYLKIPCLFFHGEEDKVSDPKISMELFNKIPDGKKEFYLVEKQYHELFQEVGRFVIVNKILQWLQQNSPQRSPKPNPTPTK